MEKRSVVQRVPKTSRGFTLVEMLVSIALFAIVMVVAVGSLLALASANKKTQALQSVMNNLNISLDGMVRSLRMGTEFQCLANSPPAHSTGTNTANCNTPQGGYGIVFTCNPVTPSCVLGKRWAYAYDSGGSICGKNAICRTLDYAASPRVWQEYTSSEVDIQDAHFYVLGTESGRAEGVQPKVIITLKGRTGGSSAREGTDFHIQATAVQRTLDL